MIRTILAAALIVGMPAAAQAANLLVNGDFEAGGGSLAGWTITGAMAVGTGAEYAPCCGTTGSEPAYSGNHFATFGAGDIGSTNAISQSFATVIGKRYDVSLRYGALGGSGTQSMNLNISDGFGFVFISAANNDLDATFSTFTTSFIASDTSTVIGFNNFSGPDGIDPILDDVSVTAVPEPASWAMLIAGFGLVGTTMRRRRVAVAG
jgi:hypothetical protein